MNKNTYKQNSISKLFLFSLNSISRKIIVISSFIFYSIVVCLYTSIIPILSGKSPMTLFSIPFSTLLLMLLVGAAISIIAVEIFRTPIDDGTEILIVSKPISRKEIIITKLTIFLVYILLLSLTGAIITSFTFLNKNSSINHGKILVLGLFLGTFINGLIFGSIATILSIYFKKIISMMISVGICFALLIITFLGSFTIKTPITILKDRNYTVAPITVIDSSLNENDDYNRMSQTNGLFSVSISEDESIKSAWNNAVSASNYKTFSFFDFGSQLSSIFTLSNPTNNIRDLISQMSVTNLPVNIEFDETYNIFSNPLLTKISVTSNDLKENNDSSSDQSVEVGSINLIPLIYDYASVNFANEWKNIYKLNFSTDFISQKENSYYLKKWEESWQKYGNMINAGQTNNVSNKSFEDSDETIVFLNSYFNEKEHTLNKSNLKNILLELSEIQLGGLLKISKDKNLNLTSFLNSNEYKTILALSELKIEKKQLLPNRSNNYVTEPTYNYYIDVKNIDTKFKYNGLVYRLDLLSNFVGVNSFKNFVKVSSKSLYNIYYTIPAWTILSIFIFITSVALYTKRDFA